MAKSGTVKFNSKDKKPAGAGGKRGELYEDI